MTSIKRPPRWVLVLWALPLLAIVLVQVTDLVGDPGIANMLSYGLVLLELLLFGLWFVLASGLPARMRYGLVGALALLLLGASQLITHEGWTGNLLPILRFGKTPPRELVIETGTRVVELSPVARDDWPGFLGRGRNLTVDLPLDPDWEAHAPELLWRHDVGAGWSGFALVAGVAITQEQRGEGQAVSAYDLRTGALLWIHEWQGDFSDPLGGPGPRSTPAVARGRVYALGPNGRLVCLDGRDGSLVWEHDLRAEYGMTDELEQVLVVYGRANSPLIYRDMVVVPAGGDPKGRQAGLVAFDLGYGELAWESPPRQISFASPSAANICGRDQILIVNEGTVSGHDWHTGAILWEHPWPGSSSSGPNCSQARTLRGDRVLISKGYGQGAAVLQLALEGEVITVEELWHERRALRTKFTNAAIFGETAVALSDGILECVSLADGKRVWKNGRHGHGQILKVRDHLLVLTERGELLLIDPSPEGGGEVLARQDVLEGKTWNNLALSGDLLAVRNGREASVWRLPLLEE